MASGTWSGSASTTSWAPRWPGFLPVGARFRLRGRLRSRFDGRAGRRLRRTRADHDERIEGQQTTDQDDQHEHGHTEHRSCREHLGGGHSIRPHQLADLFAATGIRPRPAGARAPRRCRSRPTANVRGSFSDVTGISRSSLRGFGAGVGSPGRAIISRPRTRRRSGRHSGGRGGVGVACGGTGGSASTGSASTGSASAGSTSSDSAAMVSGSAAAGGWPPAAAPAWAAAAGGTAAGMPSRLSPGGDPARIGQPHRTGCREISPADAADPVARTHRHQHCEQNICLQPLRPTTTNSVPMTILISSTLTAIVGSQAHDIPGGHHEPSSSGPGYLPGYRQ